MGKKGNVKMGKKKSIKKVKDKKNNPIVKPIEFQITQEGMSVPISLSKLIGMLYTLDRADIVTLYARTKEHRIRKTSKYDTSIKNPWINKETGEVEIRKIQKTNGCINVDYGSSVNRQRDREGKPTDFIPEKRAYGERVGDSKVLLHHITKKEQEYRQYIQFRPVRCLDRRYVDFKNNEIPIEQIEPFLGDRKKTSRQGTKKITEWRNYRVENIFAVKMRGQLYVVRNYI